MQFQSFQLGSFYVPDAGVWNVPFVRRMSGRSVGRLSGWVSE